MSEPQTYASRVPAPDAPLSSWPRAMRAVSGILGGYAFAGGVITLLGWYLEIPSWQGWDGHGITMKANAAICAAAGGAALLVQAVTRSFGLVRALGALTCTVAALTLLEHAIGLDLGIDTLLFDEPAGARATTSPGRMGPPASIAFSAIGLALLLIGAGTRARRAASVLALVPVLVSALGIFGYLYGASQLYAVARFTGIALQTGTMLLALGVGLALAVPDHGFAAALRRDDPGGVLFRRLLLPVIVIPIVIARIRDHGELAGLYDRAFGTAARTLVEIVLFIGLVWWTANGVSRHARAARQAEQALREANRRKDEFLATLAHELRNPLAPLNNSLELLRTHPDERDAARARDTMRRQLSHLVHLVDDLLDVSRISRGTIELRSERVDLMSVVDSAIEATQPLIADSGHELSVTRPSEPVFVRADVTRLAQVVSNLLNNAAKYTPQGGHISVSVEADGDEAVVRVRDDGMGISPDVLPSIFDMFTRAATHTHGALGGLGIGLALVKQLVSLHAGRIEVHSPPRTSAGGAESARGSEFVVRLPALAGPVLVESAVVQHDSDVTAAAPTSPPADLTILIADDNVDAAETLAALLAALGHTTHVAHDGHAALEAVTNVRPDVAFLDIGMPELDGYELCRRIRAHSWGAEIFVIALTGWGQPEDREASAAAGFDHHLVKPAALDEIRALLRQAGAPASTAAPSESEAS